jgi:hypothetical protein
MQAAGAPRLAAVYFLVQAALVPLWWGMLFSVPASRGWFLPVSDLDPAFRTLLLPDLAVLAFGSAVAGALALRQHAMARPAAWFVVGALAYATAYTVAWTIHTGAPLLSTVLMLAAAGASIICARRLSR